MKTEKIKWVGDEKFTPLYGKLIKGRAVECESNHAQTFIKSGQAEKITDKEFKDILKKEEEDAPDILKPALEKEKENV